MENGVTAIPELDCLFEGRRSSSMLHSRRTMADFLQPTARGPDRTRPHASQPSMRQPSFQIARCGMCFLYLSIPSCLVVVHLFHIFSFRARWAVGPSPSSSIRFSTLQQLVYVRTHFEPDVNNVIKYVGSTLHEGNFVIVALFFPCWRRT